MDQACKRVRYTIQRPQAGFSVRQVRTEGVGQAAVAPALVAGAACLASWIGADIGSICKKRTFASTNFNRKGSEQTCSLLITMDGNKSLVTIVQGFRQQR